MSKVSPRKRSKSARVKSETDYLATVSNVAVDMSSVEMVSVLRSWLSQTVVNLNSSDAPVAKIAADKLRDVFIAATAREPRIWDHAERKTAAKVEVEIMRSMSPSIRTYLMNFSHPTDPIRHALQDDPPRMGALALEMAAKGSTSEDVNVVNAFVVIFLDACFHLFCGAIPSPDGDAPPDVARNFRSRVGQLLPMSLDALGAYSDEQIVELVKVWAESKRGPKGPRGSSAGSKFERLAAFAKTLGVYVAPDTLQDEAERHRKNLGVREREFFGWMRDNYNSQRKVERSSVGNKKD